MTKKSQENIFQRISGAKIDDYRPVVFWSINSALNENELRRQIKEMKSFGLGGFVFHARAGLETEYLSEDWFRYVGICLEEARAQGMHVWLYDEFGWPSGFAGGKLLAEERNRACYLEYEVRDFYDPAAYAVYTVENGIPRLLKKGEQAAQYHTIYLRTSDAYVDILNPDVTRQFLALTHEQYYARFAASFGKELLGLFTDEPQYYRYATPITRIAEEEYRAEYGEDLKEGLLWLFLKNERGYPFRIRYYNFLNRLYCENFYRIVYDWCNAHGCMLTGHSIEENAFFAQMWGGADCATSYLYEHVPAIDNLARLSDPVISAKNVASVAAQTGRQQILTETFGCTGYGITPRQLRLIAEKQYVRGVNTMCQHLYNYSLAGQGKIDHPVSFGRALPWIKGYPAFNDYFAKLGYLLGTSFEEAAVAVISPMESVYLDYVRLDEQQTIAEVDGGYAEIAQTLQKQGIAYHLVNEKVLSVLGEAKDGRLRVGKRDYGTIVLANCRELKANTVALLRKFLASGGKLKTMGTAPAYVEGERADLSDLVCDCELPRPACIVKADVAYTVRTMQDGKRLIFAVNDAKEPRLLQLNDAFSAVDLVNGTEYAAKESYIVPPESSLLLTQAGESLITQFEETSRETLVPVFCGSDNNCLTLENATVTLEDGERLSGYVYGLFERLVKRRYCGKLCVQFTFESEVACAARLTAERQPADAVRFNGKEILFTENALDCNFLTADVQIECGKNIFTYETRLQKPKTLCKVLFGDTPESLRNCISYHTCLEPVYLEGEFDTHEFCIVASKEKSAGDLTRMGYENFCGKVRYRVSFTGGGRMQLRPVGDFSMCECTIGGQTQTVLLGDAVEFLLPEGEHTCEIVCASTMRNRFGPFHSAWKEEYGVSPDHFTLRGGWTQAGENEHFTAERHLVPFGLSAVELIRGH